MGKSKKILILALTAFLSLSAAAFSACSGSDDKTQVDSDIVNGGFETTGDDWVGWTKTGTAFGAQGITQETVFNTQTDIHISVPIDVTGKNWFCGLRGGSSSFQGTLQSNTFTLSGTGKIAFKMGAGKDKEKVYVEFCKENGEVIKKVANDDFDGVFITDQLIRRVVDLSGYVGQNIYIKVTDNDKAKDYEYGYVNLDDFVVCKSQEDIIKYEKERAEQLEKYIPDFDEDETETTVRNGGFEEGLYGWLVLEGRAFSENNIAPVTQKYWDVFNSYGKGDYYFDGVNNGAVGEGETGSMRSTRFTLGGDGYISFMIGAAHNKAAYVAICDGQTGNELIKITNDSFNDPNLPNMLRRVYVDASQYIGKVLYIKIVDKATNDFGFINVDDFVCSLTEEQVLELEKAQYDEIKNMPEDKRDGKWQYLMNYYDEYDYPVAMPVLKVNTAVSDKFITPSASVNLEQYLSEVDAVFGTTPVTDIRIDKVEYNGAVITEGFASFDMSAEGSYIVTYTLTYLTETKTLTFTVLSQNSENQIVNGGFETGDLTGWTVITEGWAMTDGKYGGVISAQTYWAEGLPYNQSGNYHLDGWNTGIDEGDTWEIRSSTFTLAGSGWITLKMGGNAACVKVYKQDGTQIGEYRQTQFSDTGFPNVTAGHWADMHTYAINLSEYLGENLYIELCDVSASGWAHAFFDEVITYYAEAPDVENSKDIVNNSIGSTPETVEFPWIEGVNILIKEQ